MHDELTGGLNYRFSLESLKKEFERSKRYKKNLTIAIIDIDHFKNINDAYGHLVGNDTLKAFSNIIKNNLREVDISGRYGGDEFVLIFPESSAEQGMKIVTRIKTALSESKITSAFLISKKDISVTFSAGLASFSAHNKTMNNLIDTADKALYQAKNEGRNKIVAY
ncbi:MAG: GGDEF domain-containing protein [Candidatus Omnitrophica bacterium]|nr:GGDEF domain-containing protein [Candidatus Omnitrophota bacterium]